MHTSKKYIMVLLLLAPLIPSSALQPASNEIVINAISEVTTIDGDAKLAELASSGSGSRRDPFVIEATITGSGSENLLTVKNTKDYFVIQNSVFTNANWSVVFDNVVNGGIRDSTITDSIGGILLTDTTFSVIDNVSISNFKNNAFFGIALYESSHNSVYASTIDFTKSSGSLQLQQYTDPGGVKSDPSDFNTFDGNTIIGAATGFVGEGSVGNTISNNVFQDNTVGVYLKDMTTVSILRNDFQGNKEVAIQVIDSFNINIEQNSFKDNGEVLIIENPGITTTIPTATNTDIPNFTLTETAANFPFLALLISGSVAILFYRTKLKKIRK